MDQKERAEIIEGMAGAIKAGFEEVFGHGRAPHGDGSPSMPPEYQTQIKKIIAGELSEAEQGRFFFNTLAAGVVTHKMDVDALKLQTVADRTYHSNLQHTQADHNVGLWIDRTTNPDEVAQLTETMRKGTAGQLDALAVTMATKIASILFPEGKKDVESGAGTGTGAPTATATATAAPSE